MITDRSGNPTGNAELYDINEFAAKVEYQFEDEHTYFWSLPDRVLGNQIFSYGGNLTVTQTTEGQGSYVPDQDVIIQGNGMTLVYQRRDYNDGVSVKPFLF